MIDEKQIKPIPKYILKQIRKAELKKILNDSAVRYYSYLTKMHGELVKVIVACKNNPHSKHWRYKQVVIHGIHSDKCLLKDICRHFMGNYAIGWYEEGLQKERKWFESEDWGWQYDKYFNIPCPILNAEYALKFPEYRYSALDEYPYADTLKYLRLYEKYPQAEMLVKFGLSAYATSIQILRKAGKDKYFRKWLAANRMELNKKEFYVETVLQAYRTGKPFLETQIFLEQKKKFFCDQDYKPIKELFRGKELERFFAYIKKQNTDYRSYLDYLNACNYLGLDMAEEKNRLPHDFKRWHNIRIDEYHTAKTAADEKERKEFYQKFATVTKKYISLQKCPHSGFAVLIAKSPKELIREGDILHHCVGRVNYDQKFVREESLIFFIRNAETPHTPFVTLEYSPSQKRVLQCYGDCDTKPNDDVLEFVYKKWLPFANKQLKKIQKAAKNAA